MLPPVLRPYTLCHFRRIQFFYLFNAPKGDNVVPGDPFQKTDKQKIDIKGARLVYPAFRHRQHVFGGGGMIPIEGREHLNLFVITQGHQA
jgi:hypothetical protein